MKPDQYNHIYELLSEFSSLSAALESAEAEIKTIQIAAAKDLQPKHAQAKVKLSEVEAKLRKYAETFYEDLFPAEKRDHKTPFGTLSFRKSSSIQVEDEEVAILKIKLECEREHLRKNPVRFSKDQLLRTREELNLEALEKLDDVTLSLFGLKREHKDNFKVVPFELKADKPASKKQKDQKLAA